MDLGWLEAPVESGRAAGLGIYVHVPFCRHRCGYCDFATWDDADEVIPVYLAALHTSVTAGSERADGPITSLFIGGGTPTRLTPEQLAALVGRVLAEHDVAHDLEVTVECNPDDATPELFEALVAAGVTRVSVGAQSFQQHVLTTLERTHGVDGPARAVAMARDAGIAHVSLDLIYGTPTETDDDWLTSIRQAVATGVDHVSAYALTIHDNTPFGRRVRDGSMVSPDPDVQRSRFDVALDELADSGFVPYELSNWAREAEARSRHNLLYWRHGNYLAHGVGAHGHFDGHRWWHHRSLARWLTAVEDGGDGVAGTEVLDADERALERLMLGLRLADGISERDLPPLDENGLQSALSAGLVTFEDNRLRPTLDGWFLVDEAVRLLSGAP